jgi:hypothetical protein
MFGIDKFCDGISKLGEDNRDRDSRDRDSRDKDSIDKRVTMMRNTWIKKSLIAVIFGVTAVVATTPAHADVLCVSKTARVNKKGQLPLGAQMFVRAACKSNEVAVLNTSQMTGPKGDPGVIGTAGAQGAKGDKGDTGAVGPKGDPGPGVSWVEASSAIEMEANIGYIVTGGNQVDLTLPNNLAVGDIIQIRQGRQRTPWRVLPGAAGQIVQGYEGIAAAGPRRWGSIAASDDGQKLAATTANDGIYTSTDAGVSWAPSSGSGQREWGEIASSSDGMRLVTSARALGAERGYLYTSDDGGQDWVERTGAGEAGYHHVASSSDGTKLVAAQDADTDWQNGPGGWLYTSLDGGGSWTKRDSAGRGYWGSVVSSSDGLMLAGIVRDPKSIEKRLVTSSDGGLNWTSRIPPDGLKWSWVIASSSDGRTLVSPIGSSPDGDAQFIAISTDGGVTWVKNEAAGEKPWMEVASSSDGQTLYATAEVEGEMEVYRSVNGGASWELAFSLDEFFGLRTSANGATVYGITYRPNVGNFLFSSAMRGLTEIKGYGQLKLMYLGENTFGTVQ